MLTKEKLPKHIKEQLKNFSREQDTDYEVFPSKIRINNQLYYQFVFIPSEQTLVLRDDGSVPTKGEAKDIALLASAYNTSFNHFIGIGFKWIKGHDRKGLEKLHVMLQSAVKNLEHQAPSQVKDALREFASLPAAIMEYQRKLEEAVEKGIDQADQTNDRELVTEEDYKIIREYNRQMVICAFEQNEIQLKTEKQRKIVLNYLAKKPRYWPLYLYLKWHDLKMLSKSKTNHFERDEVKQLISKEDRPLEENELAPEKIKKMRNPD
jgi:hypothetical protein